jgi:hypothetical protein
MNFIGLIALVCSLVQPINKPTDLLSSQIPHQAMGIQTDVAQYCRDYNFN